MEELKRTITIEWKKLSQRFIDNDNLHSPSSRRSRQWQ